MSYFVTGATGFIGRNLVERLLQREGTIYALVRAGSRGRLEELRTGWSVVVAGRARRLHTSEAARLPADLLPDVWARGPRSSVIAIELTRVEGRRLRQQARQARPGRAYEQGDEGQQQERDGQQGRERQRQWRPLPRLGSGPSSTTRHRRQGRANPAA